MNQHLQGRFDDQWHKIVVIGSGIDWTDINVQLDASLGLEDLKPSLNGLPASPASYLFMYHVPCTMHHAANGCDFANRSLVVCAANVPKEPRVTCFLRSGECRLVGQYGGDRVKRFPTSPVRYAQR